MRLSIFVLVLIFAANPAAGLGHDAPEVDDTPITVTAAREGVTRVAIVIGVDGHVSRCRVVKSGGSPSMDEAVCRMAREKMTARPAMANGIAVASEKIIPVRWKAMPKRQPAACYSRCSSATVTC